MTETVRKEGGSSDDGGARRTTKLVQAVMAVAEPIVASFGCELDRVEYRQGPRRALLQVFIDKPGGVTHEDCARVSRQLSAELDVNDFIAAAYDLEVSSPGLDRPLSGEADFRKFAGRPASLTLRRAVAGAGSKVSGILRGVDGSEVAVELKDGRIVKVPVEMVAKGRLEPEL